MNRYEGPDITASLFDGYLYFYFDEKPSQLIGKDAVEKLFLEGYGETSDSDICVVEYKESSTDSAWKDGKDKYVITGNSTKLANRKTYFRIKFAKDGIYKIHAAYMPASNPVESAGKSSKTRYIKIEDGSVMWTQKVNLVDPDATTTPEATTTTDATTTPEVTTTTNVATTTQKQTTTTQNVTTTAVETTVPVTVEPTTSEDITTGQDVTTKSGNVKAPGATKVKKIAKKKRSAKKIKVTLTKAKGAVGYEVSVYKSKKNAKKNKKAIVKKFTTKVKYTLKSKKLKNKKKLFVRARAYALKLNGEKVFGPYSNIKKVKIK